MKINNRRYLGNKYRLLSFIKETVEKECKNINTVFDAFSGTGAVASAFVDKTIFVNDILYSNHIAHIAWFLPETYDHEKIKKIIYEYNTLENLSENNYMSYNFSNTYFCNNVCIKIGHIREDIENKFKQQEINIKERAILITSLLYAMDKIATTCGHYDAYRKGAKHNDKLVLEIPEMFPYLAEGNKCYNMDANKLAEEIVCDLVYLDPPYNSRQYCDSYHLLENIARWEKNKVYGVAKKMDRSTLKSDYCTNKAPMAFEELISKLKCKYILFSYNNTANSANDRSNAKLSDEDILRILSKRGKVKVFSSAHKAFTTGKSENHDNRERLFLCEVNNDFISSPLNYTGGKARLLPQIKPFFPNNISTMIDLFCGGASVGANTEALNHYYNDISENLIGLLQTIKNTEISRFVYDIENIIDSYNLSNSSVNGYEYYACNSTDGLSAYNKDKYNKLKDDFNLIAKRDLVYYELFFVLIVFSFNNQIRFNSSGKFNLPVGKRDFNNNIRIKLVKFMKRLQQQHAIFTSHSFEELDLSRLDENSFVYCDPPYLLSNATYNENGGWNENSEKKLLAFLDKLNNNGIRFALSNVLEHKGKTNVIVQNWAIENNFHIHYLNYNYRNSNYHSKNTDKVTKEVLITNYQKDFV